MGLQRRNSERRLHHVRSQVAPGYFVQLVHIVDGLLKEGKLYNTYVDAMAILLRDMWQSDSN